MDDYEALFMQILDLIATYCKSSEDFEYIINNIEIMRENFEEEGEDEDE